MRYFLVVRDDGRQHLLKGMMLFCEHDIDISYYNSTYVARHGRSRLQNDHVTLEHHCRLNIFFVIMDKQLQGLNDMFSEQTMKL